jgi:hypothetical protein
VASKPLIFIPKLRNRLLEKVMPFFSCIASFKSECVTFLFATYVKEHLYAVKHDKEAERNACLLKKVVFDSVPVFFESVKPYTLLLLYRFRCALRIWVRIRGSVVVIVAVCETCAVTAICQRSICASVGEA